MTTEQNNKLEEIYSQIVLKTRYCLLIKVVIYNAYYKCALVIPDDIAKGFDMVNWTLWCGYYSSVYNSYISGLQINEGTMEYNPNTKTLKWTMNFTGNASVYSGTWFYGALVNNSIIKGDPISTIDGNV